MTPLAPNMPRAMTYDSWNNRTVATTSRNVTARSVAAMYANRSILKTPSSSLATSKRFARSSSAARLMELPVGQEVKTQAERAVDWKRTGTSVGLQQASVQANGGCITPACAWQSRQRGGFARVASVRLLLLKDLSGREVDHNAVALECNDFQLRLV